MEKNELMVPQDLIVEIKDIMTATCKGEKDEN